MLLFHFPILYIWGSIKKVLKLHSFLTEIQWIRNEFIRGCFPNLVRRFHARPLKIGNVSVAPLGIQIEGFPNVISMSQSTKHYQF